MKENIEIIKDIKKAVLWDMIKKQQEKTKQGESYDSFTRPLLETSLM